MKKDGSSSMTFTHRVKQVYITTAIYTLNTPKAYSFHLAFCLLLISCVKGREKGVMLLLYVRFF